LLAKEERTIQGEFKAIVVKVYMINPWHRLGPQPAALLAVRRSYLTEVPRPIPAAPLVESHRYLIVVLWLFAVARKSVPCLSQVLDRGADAVARGAARCASHVLGRGAHAGA
jgi:hypothetical protein